MKQFKHILILSAISLLATDCRYLDVDPELGLDDQTVFGTYANFRSYFQWLYADNGGSNKESILPAFPMYADFLTDYSFSWYNTTDMSDAGRMGVSQQYFKQGVITQDFLRAVSFDTSTSDKPLAKSMFSAIRRCNITIQNIDMCQDATQQQKKDLLGQAYALRGFCHFSLCRFFGGMPYLDHPLGPEESWDLPRLSTYETYRRAAEDLKKGYELLKEAGYMRRNSPLALNSATLNEINGAAAVALYARAMLYAASDYSNTNGVRDWEEAAAAAALAIQEAEEAGFTLTPAADYSKNFLTQETTNENLWTFSVQKNDTDISFRSLMAYPQSGSDAGSSGVCPTQNFIDRYETVFGEPLLTPEERQLAAAAGHYNEQDPYTGRDPRMDLTIVYDGQVNTYTKEGVINICYDPYASPKPRWLSNSFGNNIVSFGIDWGTKDNDTYAYSNTGYYCKKYWNGNFGLGQNTQHYHTDPIIRLAELYLNYAEAVNEAYGPYGSSSGLAYTAVQAVNLVRNRIGMPNVLSVYTGGKDSFRERIRNERCVELAFEGHHYYHDIRRWKIAEQTMGQVLYGMRIEKTPVSAGYPNGKKYTRTALPNNRQCLWKDYMYFLPFPDNEAYTMKNFENWTWQ